MTSITRWRPVEDSHAHIELTKFRNRGYTEYAFRAVPTTRILIYRGKDMSQEQEEALCKLLYSITFGDKK